MKIKSIKKIKSDKPINFYDITVDKYHNFSIGDSKIVTHNTSLSKAISKLARPFGSSLQVLQGYGFFGSEVSPEPAAARYTSVKLSTTANEILKKYKKLFTREKDGPYDPFWLDVPIGLTTPIVGIAVGYKTTILPRKLEDIQDYLAGKIKNVNPHFIDFAGTVKKYNGLEKSWIITSQIKVEDKKIMIRELPPIMKYTAALKKLDWLFTKFEGKVKVINDSNKKAHIDIIYSGRNNDEWQEIQNYIEKAFSVIVTETPVFIKDEHVLVYDRVEDYLEDYKWQLLRLDARNKEYLRDWTSEELEFNKCKKLFISFVLKQKRTVSDIDLFLKDYKDSIKERIESMTSKKFTTDELYLTEEKIKELTKTLREKEKEYTKSQKLYESTIDPTLARGISSQKSNIDLFDEEDIGEIDGISIWDGEDPYGKNDEIEDE